METCKRTYSLKRAPQGPPTARTWASLETPRLLHKVVFYPTIPVPLPRSAADDPAAQRSRHHLGPLQGGPLFLPLKQLEKPFRMCSCRREGVGNEIAVARSLERKNKAPVAEAARSLQGSLRKQRLLKKKRLELKQLKDPETGYLVNCYF